MGFGVKPRRKSWWRSQSLIKRFRMFFYFILVCYQVSPTAWSCTKSSRSKFSATTWRGNFFIHPTFRAWVIKESLTRNGLISVFYSFVIKSLRLARQSKYWRSDCCLMFALSWHSTLLVDFPPFEFNFPSSRKRQKNQIFSFPFRLNSDYVIRRYRALESWKGMNKR